MRTGLKIFLLIVLLTNICHGQHIAGTKIIPVGDGWANNSINTVVFRKNSLCSFKSTQFISYYNKDGFVVIGKRKFTSDKWKLRTTQLKGNVADAHNSISMMVDGDGYLHLSWNHHGNQLHYCKSLAPGSLEMSEEQPMTGSLENNVTYPEFYSLPNGNLLFLYRDGQSGQGNLVINQYDIKTQKWKQLHSNLIDGEKKRNAYWQACVDARGTLHISWVWRESSNVASNHDICYARSTDGGITWTNSSNEKYKLPITAASAEYIYSIPPNSELINQTSMTTDAVGNPFIASYWKEKGDSIPQYHVIFRNENKWQQQNLGFRKTVFSLNGAGTKRIPISRPQLICWTKNKISTVAVIFRDQERGGRVSIAINSNMNKNIWIVKDLSNSSVGSWEPSFDTELWKIKNKLHLFVQYTDQQDEEGKSTILPQPINVFEINFSKNEEYNL